MSKPPDQTARAAQENAQREIMLNDLGTGRREEMLTTDYQYNDSNLQAVYNNRECVRQGTLAHQNAMANRAALDGWSNVAPDDGPEEVSFADGQGHRSRLLDSQLPPRRSGRYSSRGNDDLRASPVDHPSYLNIQNPSRSSLFQPTSDRSGNSRADESDGLDSTPNPPRRPLYGRENRTRHIPTLSRSPPTVPSSRPPVRGGNRYLNRIFSNINQQMRQPEATSNYRYPSSRLPSTVSPSNNRSEFVAANLRKSRLSAAPVQDWGQDNLEVNPPPDRTISLALSSPIHNPSPVGTKISTTPKVELSAVNAPVFTPATYTGTTADNRARSPKRSNFDVLQSLSSNVAPSNRNDKPTDEAVKSQSALPLATSEGSHDTGQCSFTTRNDERENWFPIPAKKDDMPDIQHDPRDPLATQTRENVLSSENSFWKWKLGRSNEGSPSKSGDISVAPILPSRPTLRDSSHSNSPETQPPRFETQPPRFETHLSRLREKMMQKARQSRSISAQAEAPVLKLRPAIMQQNTPTASDRSGMAGSATLRASTNLTQWFNPSQEQLTIPARSSSITDDRGIPSVDNRPLFSVDDDDDSLTQVDDESVTHIDDTSVARANDDFSARVNDEIGTQVHAEGIANQVDDRSSAGGVLDACLANQPNDDDVVAQAVDYSLTTLADYHLGAVHDDHSVHNRPPSPADSGGITDLTRRLSSISLMSALPPLVQESDEDETSSDDMTMIEGYPISVRTLRAKFNMSRKEFRDRYNPDA